MISKIYIFYSDKLYFLTDEDLIHCETVKSVNDLIDVTWFEHGLEHRCRMKPMNLYKPITSDDRLELCLTRFYDYESTKSLSFYPPDTLIDHPLSDLSHLGAICAPFNLTAEIFDSESGEVVVSINGDWVCGRLICKYECNLYTRRKIYKKELHVVPVRKTKIGMRTK